MSGIPVMLVGNKCDEETSKRQVAKKMGEALQVKGKYSSCFSTKATSTQYESNIFGIFGGKSTFSTELWIVKLNMNNWTIYLSF